jgi:hypothetical protein
MRLIVLSVTALFVGSLFVVYGALLASRPDLFLKFHDIPSSNVAPAGMLGHATV